MADNILSVDRVRSLFNYNQETGEISWRETINDRVRVGDVAGCGDGQGYVRIGVHGRSYKAHRIAWVHVNGEWPAGEIDHINGNRSDNRIKNLRDVSGKINQQNRKCAPKNSKSGLLGASRHAKGWAASISINGENKYIGLYRSAQEAHEAYVLAKREAHPGCTI